MLLAESVVKRQETEERVRGYGFTSGFEATDAQVAQGEHLLCVSDGVSVGDHASFWEACRAAAIIEGDDGGRQETQISDTGPVVDPVLEKVAVRGVPGDAVDVEEKDVLGRNASLDGARPNERVGSQTGKGDLGTCGRQLVHQFKLPIRRIAASEDGPCAYSSEVQCRIVDGVRGADEDDVAFADACTLPKPFGQSL